MIPFRIGADASCTDGACGQVSRIIVNPVAREVTHLVVDPKHRHGPGRLVPVDLLIGWDGPDPASLPPSRVPDASATQVTEIGPGLEPTGHGQQRGTKGHGIVGGSLIM